MGDGPNDRGLSRHHLIPACEASLKRLRTDCIDLYQVHQWDGETPLEETLDALDTLVRQGKVRYVGCSNFSGWHIMKALGVSAAEGMPALRQPADPLHARGARGRVRAGADLDRPGARHPGLEPDRRRPALGQVPPRQEGARKARASSPAGTSRRSATRSGSGDIVDVLVEIAEARGVSAAQVALAWLLGRPGVTSVIIGGRTEAQFKDNLAAAELKLDRRRAAAPRRGQRAAAPLSLLAPAVDGEGPARRGRSVAARAFAQGLGGA